MTEQEAMTWFSGPAGEELVTVIKGEGDVTAFFAKFTQHLQALPLTMRVEMYEEMAVMGIAKIVKALQWLGAWGKKLQEGG